MCPCVRVECLPGYLLMYLLACLLVGLPDSLLAMSAGLPDASVGARQGCDHEHHGSVDGAGGGLQGHRLGPLEGVGEEAPCFLSCGGELGGGAAEGAGGLVV
eukprot:7752429-Alexandrium_andersonii.AAC.1